MKVKSEREVTQLGPTPSNPMDCSPPGSSVHGIFQARVGWGAIAFSEHIHTTIYKIDGQQDLLYNTGNFQYLTVTYNGKESEQEKYIYRIKSLWCTPETNIL